MRPPALAILLAVLAGTAVGQTLDVHHIAVGQGDAALIVGPTGTTCLIDAGPAGAGTNVVVPLLNQLGITTLHYMIVTHYHDDHYGGIAEVVAAGFLPSIAAYDRGTLNQPTGSSFNQYVNAIASKRTTISPGASIDMGGGATLLCLGVNGLAMSGAFVVLTGTTSQQENARSVCLKLSFGDFQESLGGDLTGGTQGTPNVESIIAPLMGDVDVYKVHHHGALDASSGQYVGAIAPEVSVISADNSPFNFPAQGVLDILLAQPTYVEAYRLHQAGTAIGGTVVGGTLRIQTDGSSYTCTGGSITPLTRDVDETFPPPSMLHVAGSVVVSEFMADPASVSDTAGEWIELRNTTGSAIPLRGVAIRDFGTDYFVLPSLTLPALGYVVIGRNGNPANNGGYAATHVWPTNSFFMGNAADQIEVISPQGVVLDVVAYDGGPAFPDPTGASVERIDATEPSIGSNFAVALTPFGVGDLGTPGSLNSRDQTPPIITAEPNGQTVCEGAALVLSVAAAGTGPLSYQWRLDGAPIGGATSSTYSVPAASAGDAGIYDVVVGNLHGSRESQPAAVVVDLLPVVDTQPPSQEVCELAPVTFTAAASGAQPLAFQWRRDGADIPGATGSSYDIASATAADEGVYDVVVTNGCGATASAPATLSVSMPAAIDAGPQSQSACFGAPVSFSVIATGSNLAYQWRKGELDIPGATSATHAIAAVETEHQGSYTVVVSNACGMVTSAAATLTVTTPPAITAQPQNASPCAGTGAQLSAGASGTPPLAFQWRKNGAEIPGATFPVHEIVMAAPADAGDYDVVVTNACGIAISAPATLAVIEPPVIGGAPTPQEACAGSPATFTVSASGTAPAYQWRKDGSDIPGATSPAYAIVAVSAGDAGSYDVVVTNACGSVTSAAAALVVPDPVAIDVPPAAASVCEGDGVMLSVAASGAPPLSYQWRKDGADIPGATSPVHAIPITAAADDGSYDVVVTNACGPVISPPAIVAVGTPPVVMGEPVSMTVCEGAPALFTVSVMGAEPFTYQWRKAGADIPGATGATLAIPAAGAADEAAYDVVITNACGQVMSAAAQLALFAPVSITTQPAAPSPCLGDLLTLTVAASGTPPLSYQWRKDGVDLPGRTLDVLQIAAAAATDSGTYDVVVTDACGSITSAGALVAVGVPSILALSPPLIAIMAPATPPIPVTVAGSCFTPASVVYANGTPLATTFVDPATLTCELPPAVPQTQIPGGICFNVADPAAPTSNSVAMVVGTGNNAGTIRREPLAPAPGHFYSIVMEGGVPFAPVSLFADFGMVNPIVTFPDPATNFVLALTPLTGSAGPFVVAFDGLAVFGVSWGTVFDASGSFVLPGIQVPFPLFGVSVTLQAVYADPSSPLGWRLTWARFPESI